MAADIIIVSDSLEDLQGHYQKITDLGYNFEIVTVSRAKTLLLTNKQCLRVVVFDLSGANAEKSDKLATLAKFVKLAYPIAVIAQISPDLADKADKALETGAYDFIMTCDSLARIDICLRNAIQNLTLKQQPVAITANTNDVTFATIICNSAKMRDTIAIAQKVALSQIPILIEGESGVGKELFARAISKASLRNNMPFVAVNCGAIPHHLVESILFGHEKGAFTGATEKHAGKFKEADGGTLFLDEVGELPLGAQVKLLRALQENEIEPVGANHPSKVDIRIISATNKKLVDLVRQGNFRDDLYYRINVFPIQIPPLRQRTDDIVPLAKAILAKLAAKEQRELFLSPNAWRLLEAYSWPGNVRELENSIFKAVVLSESNELNCSHFSHITLTISSTDSPYRRLTSQKSELCSPGDGGYPIDPGGGDSYFDIEQVVAPPSQPTARVISSVDRTGTIRTLSSVEHDHIRQALVVCDWQISKSAKYLGIGRSTLYRKMKELGIVNRDQIPMAKQQRMIN